MAINLYSYVNNPFTNKAVFNFAVFENHVRLAQKLMDDLVDLEIEKVDAIIKKIEKDPEDDETKRVELNLWKKIREKAVDGRRTGLGITAEGDMLSALGYKYASKEGIEFSTKVHQTLAVESYSESIVLANERGSFKGFDYVKDMNSGFCKRISKVISNDYLDAWRKYGRRNIGNLTIAPTGTVSIMTQTTSGIEPVFMVAYKRRRKTGDKSKAVFTDRTGEMFEEYRVLHPKFIEWYSVTKALPYEVAKEELSQLDDKTFQTYFESSPYYGSTAQDIDWVAKVKMQGEIQKWVDHSISCTVNMPNDTPVEVVDKVYMAAWKSGCKGVTIYRDGSRDGVLVSEKPKETTKNKSLSRPDALETRVIRFRNNNENWIAFIGVLDERPFEVFTGKIDDDIKHLPKSIDKGIVNKIEYETKDEDGIKVKMHRYDFQYEVGFGYINTLPDIGNAFNPETYNYARMVSAMLQEGMNLDKIINVLLKLKCGDTINVWNKGVARALKKFIEDGTKSSEKCEICGGDMVYEGGCKHCTSCGASKCE
jgi:ribonucleoside-diphosphate reductase alpha chain